MSLLLIRETVLSQTYLWALSANITEFSLKCLSKKYSFKTSK